MLQFHHTHSHGISSRQNKRNRDHDDAKRHSHLPDGALGKPDIVGNGEQGGSRHEIPRPRIGRLDERLANYRKTGQQRSEFCIHVSQLVDFTIDGICNSHSESRQVGVHRTQKGPDHHPVPVREGALGHVGQDQVADLVRESTSFPMRNSDLNRISTVTPQRFDR